MAHGVNSLRSPHPGYSTSNLTTRSARRWRGRRCCVPTSAEYPRRVAMISMHTSPLATPGVGDAGGLNVYVAEVARRLGERGLKVDVFTRAEDRDVDEIVEIHEHTRVISLPAGPRAMVAKESLISLLPEFSARVQSRIDSYDVVHSHYWLSGLVGLDLQTCYGMPLVHTMHTMARVKNASLGQIVIVPPGVDLHTFHPCDQPKSRANLGVAQDAQVILFVGRIQPLKAPDVLIRAVAELARRQPARRDLVKLIIIGSPSGPESDWSRTLPPLARSLGVEDMVEFRPHAVRGELFRWYCASNVVGLPSHNESFGLVALEAQACGRPVVATDVGGLRHAIDDQRTGILVGSHKPDDWATALAGVLDDEEEALRLGINGAIRAAHFSWDNSASATLQAYHQALRP